MTPRGFLGLAAVTVIAFIAAAWAVIAERNANAVPEPGNEPMFRQVVERSGDIARIRIETADDSIVLERRDGTWVAASKGGYPVRQGSVTTLITGVAALRPYEAKTDNPAWYSRIGVEDVTADGARSSLVTFETADEEQLAALLVGMPSASIGSNPLGGTFIRRPDEAQAWLAQGRIILPNSTSEWFDQIIHVPGPQVVNVTVLEGDEVVFEAAKPEEDRTRYVLVSARADATAEGDTPAEGSVVNDSAVKRVAQGIVSVSLEDVRPADEVTFAEDGRTVRFETVDGMILDVELGEADGETWVRYTATAPEDSEAVDDAQAITDRTAGWAFKLPGYKMSALTFDLAGLVEAPPEPEPPAPADGALGPGGPAAPFLPPAAGAGPRVAPAGPGDGR